MARPSTCTRPSRRSGSCDHTEDEAVGWVERSETHQLSSPRIPWWVSLRSTHPTGTDPAECEAMSDSEIDAIRALLGSKPRPVGWTERRQRLDEVGSAWPVADDVAVTPV